MVVDAHYHPMFVKALGAGCSYGCNVGRISPMPFSFASATTQDEIVYVISARMNLGRGCLFAAPPGNDSRPPLRTRYSSACSTPPPAPA